MRLLLAIFVFALGANCFGQLGTAAPTPGYTGGITATSPAATSYPVGSGFADPATPIATPASSAASTTAQSATSAAGKASFFCGTLGMDCMDHIGVALTSGGANLVTASPTAGARCVQMANATRMACLTVISPIIAQASSVVLGGITAIKGLSGQSAVCSKAGKIAGVVEKALIAYNAACGGATLACNLSCGQAVTELTSTTATWGAIVAPTVVPATTTAQALTSACTGYKLKLATMGISIMVTRAQKKMANNCAKNTSVASTDEQICKDNPSLLSCVCQSNPNDSRCPGAKFQPTNPATLAAASTPAPAEAIAVAPEVFKPSAPPAPKPFFTMEKLKASETYKNLQASGKLEPQRQVASEPSATCGGNSEIRCPGAKDNFSQISSTFVNLSGTLIQN